MRSCRDLVRTTSQSLSGLLERTLEGEISPVIARALCRCRTIKVKAVRLVFTGQDFEGEGGFLHQDTVQALPDEVGVLVGDYRHGDGAIRGVAIRRTNCMRPFGAL